jgi:Domain of unknown function (DUF5615)
VAFALYFDEDSVNRALIRALRARGMDVTNAVDAGHAGSPDRVQLEHATADGRVLFTYNVGDFLALHTQFRQEGRSHAGLILAVQQRYTVGEQLRRILRMNRERSSEDMRNRVEFLGSWIISGPQSDQPV